MKLLLSTQAWNEMHEGKVPAPAYSPLCWPSDKPTPEGFIELMIVTPHPPQPKRQCSRRGDGHGGTLLRLALRLSSATRYGFGYERLYEIALQRTGSKQHAIDWISENRKEFGGDCLLCLMDEGQSSKVQAWLEVAQTGETEPVWLSRET